jgi:hypothetical protein
VTTGFVAPVHVRWSDIDMYQHINHATMVTLLEEARIPFLREPFEAVIDEIGLLIHEVNILYKGQLKPESLSKALAATPALAKDLKGTVTVRRGKEEVTGEFVEAFSPRRAGGIFIAQIPFADQAGQIAGTLQDLRNDQVPCCERNVHIGALA